MRRSLRTLLPPAWLRSPSALIPLAAAAVLAIAFVLATGLVWEDFLITYRYSENLVHGLGLVYWPGERVHGFTSPLNTLLPALFAWIVRAKDFEIPLFLFRIVSLVMLLFGVAAAASALRQSAPESKAVRLAAFLFPIIALLEIKTCAFAMNGQEAGLMIGFLGSSFALALLGWAENWALGAVLWAGLLYTRPDAFVSIGAISLSALVFERGPRGRLFLGLLKSATVSAALYLPWILFATWYFGSPVPHTIIAKYGTATYNYPAFHLMAPFAAGTYWLPRVLCWVLAPVNDWLDGGIGAWPPWMHDLGLILELIAVLYWAVPTRDRAGRMASFIAFILCAYLTYTKLVAEYAPWYFPPVAFVSLFALTSAATTAARRDPKPIRGFAVGAAGLALLVSFLGFEYAASLKPLELKQQYVENGNRKLLGLWLKAHAQPGDTVYLEPLGYIGYYSGCHMLDFPGLVSPAVVAARRQTGAPVQTQFAAVANLLRPRWIVLRPSDVAQLKQFPYVAKNYQLMKYFDVSAALKAAGGTSPGMDGVYSDAQFAVVRRSD